MTDDNVLNYLGQAYFHQDYEFDAESPADLVKAFAYDESTDYVQALVDQLDMAISSDLSESEAQYLWKRQAKAMYEPQKDGKSYLNWLNDILVIARDALHDRGMRDGGRGASPGSGSNGGQAG